MPAIASLTVLSEHQVVLLMAAGEFHIGRGSKNDLPLSNRTVSRRHATIVIDENCAQLVDQKSRNGTFIRDERIEQQDLEHRMEIRFGDVRCLFAWLQGPHADEVSTTIGSSQNNTPSPTLTPAEERVFWLLLSGHSEKEIAKKIHLSPHTVHNHVRHIYRAYEVKSRSELLAKFVRTDLKE